MALSLLKKLVRNFPENGPKLLLENPANVRDLLVRLREPAVDQIDFSAMTVERSHFVQPDYRHVAVDLLLKAPFRTVAADKSEAILIYLLVEHQSTPQRFFHLRLAEYLLEAYKMQKRAWDEHHSSDASLRLHPVLPVVLYTGERHWQRIEVLADLIHEGERFRALIPDFKPHFLNLPQTPAQTLEQAGGFFGQVLWLIQQRHADAAAFQHTLEQVLAALEKMSAPERTRWVEFLSYTLALMYHARNEQEHPHLREVVDRSVQTDPHRKEYGKMGRTIAEMFIDKGRIEGEIKGKREGKREATLETERAILLRLLHKRFKKVPRKVEARIAAATDCGELETWLENLIGAVTLADVGIPID